MHCVVAMYRQNVFLLITGCKDGFGMVDGACIGNYVIVCYVYVIVFVTSNVTGMHL